MTKFDIFVVNLRRSADRREAMREKIKRICGFEKIYIDGEVVVDSADSQNLEGGLPRRFCESARNDKFLDSSRYRAQNDNLNLDSATRNNSSLRNFAKQSCGNPQGFARAVARSNHPPIEKVKDSQSGLPRRFCESARNDDFLLDSAHSAESALNFHFFPATDATDFKNEKSPLPPQYSSKLTRFVKGKDLSFGEMACFSSHYRLWQKCVELDLPIIVLEDDIDFMQDFCQIVDIFKSPFEYVRLYYLFDRKITHLYDNFYISFDRTAGTQGYYLTPQAAQKFIKNARFWLFCVDDYMDMFFIHSVKNIIFKPFIISEDLHSATQSTILGREKPQMRFYQKLTRELSRIYFFVIRKYLYFTLHFVEIRAFFRAHKVAQKK